MSYSLYDFTNDNYITVCNEFDNCRWDQLKDTWEYYITDGSHKMTFEKCQWHCDSYIMTIVGCVYSDKRTLWNIEVLEKELKDFEKCLPHYKKYNWDLKELEDKVNTLNDRLKQEKDNLFNFKIPLKIGFVRSADVTKSRDNRLGEIPYEKILGLFPL